MMDKDGLTGEVTVGVTFASLMSAVSLFFTGILVAQYSSFDKTIRVPLIFLIISTFSFIFAASIYSNASSEITLGKLKLVEKYMIYAKNIVELLGLYLFILATPLVIGAVTKDNFLRTSTIIIAIVGFGLYSQSKFSVLQKELSNKQKRNVSALIVILALLLYFTQSSTHSSSNVIYDVIAVILAGFLVTLAARFSLRSRQYKPTFFRAYEESDASDLSHIILKNLARIRAKSFSSEIIEQLQKQASVKDIKEMAQKKQVYIAEFDNIIVGLAALDGNEVSMVYTDPDLHKKGIGRLLMDYVESEAEQKGYQKIDVTASALDHGFYKKLGYVDVNETGEAHKDKAIVMQKRIRS